MDLAKLQKKKRVVVVGNGMTSLRFCEKLLEYDAFHEYQVTVLGEEPYPAYDRVNLSDLFEDKSERELVLAETRWYDYQKIALQLGVRVVSINRADKNITTRAGTKIEYDILVLATGARPHIPAISGTHLQGVHVYRTLDDIDTIRVSAETASKAIVIGGGLLGLEAAEACQLMSLDTTIIERAPHLMACQLDSAGGQLLQSKVEALGIKVRTGKHVLGLAGTDTVRSARLEEDEDIPADLIILATGIQPNDELGRECGLAMGARGGIAVDETVRTSDSSIYAIGECASFNDTTFGLVAPCYAMAEAAAAHLGGINKTFRSSVPASQLKLLDLQVASLGNPHIDRSQACHVVVQDLEQGVYKKLIVDTHGKQMLGAILIGETSEFDLLRKRMEEGGELTEPPETLLAPVGSRLEPELDMEDDDLVCFCNYVSKGDICKAIDRDNLKTAAEVMDVTYAASLCGSCLDTVDTVTKHHLSLRYCSGD